MYNTAALGLQIRKLDLSWKDKGVWKTMNKFRREFGDLREIFNDEPNSDFELRPLLEARKDQDYDGYETRELVADVQDPLGSGPKHHFRFFQLTLSFFSFSYPS